MSFYTHFDDDNEDPGHNPDLPPGYGKNLQGPWLTTQLGLSLTIGLASFLFFCMARRVERWKVLYRPRTLLKGFSPHEVHDTESFFGWILPTLRTSEFTVLQIVGLDAAVLLSFLRTCFLFFLTCTILAFTMLVPINYRENGTSEGVDPPKSGNGTDQFTLSRATLEIDALRAHHGSTLYLSMHLVFTYTFTIIAFVFMWRNWKRYIPLRQLFSLELAHTIPARTVMCTNLPPHLRSERALAEYFEGIHLGEAEGSSGLGVESVTVTRAVGSMTELLDKRTKALRKLEEAWCKYLGNPVIVEGPLAVKGYQPTVEVERILEPGYSPPPSPTARDTPLATDGLGGRTGRLIDVDEPRSSQDLDDDDADLEARLLTPSRPSVVNPRKKRPMLRPGWLRKKVDALDYYAEQFRLADEEVKKRRKGRFRPTGVAFTTFESLAAAQIAAQTVHYPQAMTFQTELAPEPRDIQWFNLNLSSSSRFIRGVLVLIILLVLLSVWLVPVLFLAQLLSWERIQKVAPRLADFIGKNARLRGFVQTSLPSLAMVAFNNLLPFFLDALSTFQGLQARSWVEYSLLKKYHLTLLFTTLFVFVTSSTYTLLRYISDSPAQLPEKLAMALPGARNFFVSYVMLSGLAFMPLQLLELGTVIPRAFWQVFFTRTPRDHAELNTPSMVNLGTVYPQALLIFTLGITYSIISPLVLPFATLYFAIAYLVYKYKLLFVYYRPYESRGQAWPLAFNRIGIALFIFQIFMLGLFTVRKAFLLSGLVVPLLLATAYATWRIGETFKPLSRYVNLSQACEIMNGGANDVVRLRRGHPVTKSQTHLNRDRYKHSNEGIFVVAKNASTDYSQPPMSDTYPGVLNTGSRLYNHPALSGALPEPWLPVIADGSLDGGKHAHVVASAVKDAVTGPNAIIVDLRRRWSIAKRVVKRSTHKVVSGAAGSSGEVGSSGGGAGAAGGMPRSSSERSMDEDHPTRAWRGSQQDRWLGSGGPGDGSGGEGGAFVQEPIGHASLDEGTRRRSRREAGARKNDDGEEDGVDDDGEEEEDEGDLYEEDEGAGLSRYSTYWHRRNRSGSNTFPPSAPNGHATESEDER